MEYVLMCTAIVFSVASSAFLKSFGGKGKTENIGDLFLFNGLISAVWAVILGLWFVLSGDFHVTPLTFLFGGAYGIVLTAFLFTKTAALSEGPVSLTTLIGSCAFLIASAFGVIYNHESVNILQLLGVIVLTMSLTLCVNPKKSGEPLTKKWFLLTLMFFVAGGFIGITNKAFSLSSVSGEVNAMMLTASVVSAVLFTASAFLLNGARGFDKPRIHKGTWQYVLVCGVLSCVYQRLNVSLAGLIPSVVFFPVANGSMVILSVIAGKIVFKEKLKPIQLLGVMLGLLAIITIGLSENIISLIK